MIQRLLTLVAMLVLAACAKDAPTPAEPAKEEPGATTVELRFQAVAGLNPHAGEGGLFGREEVEAIAPAMWKDFIHT